MGIGRVISINEDGTFAVELDYDNSRIEAEIRAIDEQLEKLAALIPSYERGIEERLQTVSNLREVLQGVIETRASANRVDVLNKAEKAYKAALSDRNAVESKRADKQAEIEDKEAAMVPIKEQYELVESLSQQFEESFPNETNPYSPNPYENAYQSQQTLIDYAKKELELIESDLRIYESILATKQKEYEDLFLFKNEEKFQASVTKVAKELAIWEEDVKGIRRQYKLLKVQENSLIQRQDYLRNELFDFISSNSVCIRGSPLLDDKVGTIELQGFKKETATKIYEAKSDINDLCSQIVDLSLKIDELGRQQVSLQNRLNNGEDCAEELRNVIDKQTEYEEQILGIKEDIAFSYLKIDGLKNNRVFIFNNYVENRDGYVRMAIGCTPTQAFLCYSLLPGWQKWLPTYRLGKIKGNKTTNSEGVSCFNVVLEKVFSECQQLNINKVEELENVPVASNISFPYEDVFCLNEEPLNGKECLVYFQQFQWEKPLIIWLDTSGITCLHYIFIGPSEINSSLESSKYGGWFWGIQDEIDGEGVIGAYYYATLTRPWGFWYFFVALSPMLPVNGKADYVIRPPQWEHEGPLLIPNMDSPRRTELLNEEASGKFTGKVYSGLPTVELSGRQIIFKAPSLLIPPEHLFTWLSPITLQNSGCLILGNSWTIDEPENISSLLDNSLHTFTAPLEEEQMASRYGFTLAEFNELPYVQRNEIWIAWRDYSSQHPPAKVFVKKIPYLWESRVDAPTYPFFFYFSRINRKNKLVVCDYSVTNDRQQIEALLAKENATVFETFYSRLYDESTAVIFTTTDSRILETPSREIWISSTINYIKEQVPLYKRRLTAKVWLAASNKEFLGLCCTHGIAPNTVKNKRGKIVKKSLPSSADPNLKYRFCAGIGYCEETTEQAAASEKDKKKLPSLAKIIGVCRCYMAKPLEKCYGLSLSFWKDELTSEGDIARNSYLATSDKVRILRKKLEEIQAELDEKQPRLVLLQEKQDNVLRVKNSLLKDYGFNSNELEDEYNDLKLKIATLQGEIDDLLSQKDENEYDISSANDLLVKQREEYAKFDHSILSRLETAAILFCRQENETKNESSSSSLISTSFQDAIPHTLLMKTIDSAMKGALVVGLKTHTRASSLKALSFIVSIMKDNLSRSYSPSIPLTQKTIIFCFGLKSSALASFKILGRSASVLAETPPGVFFVKARCKSDSIVDIKVSSILWNERGEQTIPLYFNIKTWNSSFLHESLYTQFKLRGKMVDCIVSFAFAAYLNSGRKVKVGDVLRIEAENAIHAMRRKDEVSHLIYNIRFHSINIGL